MAFLLVKLGPEATQILRIGGGGVGSSGFALADTLFVIETIDQVSSSSK